MTNNAKAIIIQLILVIVSGTLMIILLVFFRSKGLENFARLSAFIPTTTEGLYILFGKYVYLRGNVTKSERIAYGLFFILIMPIIWFIKTVVTPG